MSKQIQVPTINQVDTKSQAIFGQLKKALGKVPNLYATIGYSSTALEAFLNYSNAIGKGTFNKKEIEAIKLAVAQVNGCEYCLAAHTAIAKMNGFSESETFDLRSATSSNPHLQILTQLAKEISENKGRASQSALDNFFAQGFDEAALIDLIAVVTDITFTNYTHILTQVPVDFPKAKTLPSLVTA